MTLPPRDNCTCDACCQPDPRMTPTNDAPVTGIERAKQRRAARDASGEVYVDGSIYEGMAACLVRSGKTIAHVVDYGDAVAIAAALASAPAAGSREAAMVTLRTDDSGRPKVWCDPEIVDLIDALNTDALSTVASCSGHGHRPGIIMLTDGRCLMVFRDREYAKAAEAAYPLDINGIASAPAGDGVEEEAARAYFERGFMSCYAWQYANKAAQLSDAVMDHAWDHREEGGELPALARPRAAVGEQNRDEMVNIIVDAIHSYDSEDGGSVARSLAEDALTHILALQSPPAKVEG